MRLDRLLVVCYLAIAALPVLAVVGRVRDHRVAGSLEPAPRPAPSLSGIRDERFQHAFTAWFEGVLGTRGYAIHVDNTLAYHLFGETKPASHVKVGTRGVLYERDDITHYNKSSELLPTREQLEGLVDQLARVQRLLRARKIALVPVIIPSKTSIWADTIPDRWVRALGEPRPADTLGYHRLKEALDARGVVHVDVREMFTTTPTRRELLWGPDGRHWTLYGACLALQRVLQLSGSVTGTTVDYPCHLEMRRPRRSDDDLDLWRLLNAWRVGRGVLETPMPAHSPPPPGAWKPRIHVIATSFGYQLLQDAHASHRFGRIQLDYYGEKLVSPGAEDRHLAPHTPAWREAVLGNDVLVIELFEPYLMPGPEHFVTRALTALEDELR